MQTKLDQIIIIIWVIAIALFILAALTHQRWSSLIATFQTPEPQYYLIEDPNRPTETAQLVTPTPVFTPSPTPTVTPTTFPPVARYIKNSCYELWQAQGEPATFACYDISEPNGQQVRLHMGDNSDTKITINEIEPNLLELQMLFVNQDGTAVQWSAQLKAPGNGEFQIGRNYQATGFHSDIENSAKLNLHGINDPLNIICKKQTGSFWIYALERDATGTITALEIELTRSCLQPADVRPISGYIRYNITTP